MSKIVLVIDQELSPQLLIEWKRHTQLSLSQLRARLADGKPAWECQLFMNDHDEQTRRLRDLVDLVELHTISMRVFELGPDEDYETCQKKLCQISTTILRNILDEWEMERERRQNR